MSVHLITSLRDGGAQRALYNLVCDMREHSFVIVPLLHRGRYWSVYNSEPNVMILTFWKFAEAMIRGRVLRDQIVAIVGWMYHACIAAAVIKLVFPNARLIFNIRQSFHTLHDFAPLTRTVVRATKILSKVCAPRMIFVAHSARDAHGAAGFNTSNSKVIVNGFIIPASASVRRSGRAKIEFVSASRYSAQKNITWMIECFAHVTETFPNIRLHLYGEGLDGDNSVLSGIVDELDLSETIVLHGYAETKDSIYLSKDFYLQTSSMEGFSNSLCEAMSYGVIPICSDVGDNALIVGREGYCFPRGDREQFIASLVEAIEGFLRDPKSHEKKAQRARSSIRTRFAMNRNVQAWSEELD